MRIYVIGSVASGKTTLTKNLSKRLSIPCVHLDGVVHIKDPSQKKWGNRRRKDYEIDDLFQKIISKENWLIEDAGRPCFSKGLDTADMIVYLKPHVLLRKIRIFTRYIKQKLGIEESLYTPSIGMLRFLYGALNNYEKGKDDLEKRVLSYKDKTIILRNNRDIKVFLNSFEKGQI